MKKWMLLGLGLVAFSLVNGQVRNPVEWSFSAKKINATTYEIHMTAQIENGWHTYSQTTPEGGPVPTSISFVKNPLVSLSGPAKEVGKLEKHHEKIFGVIVKQFSDRVDFVQTVTLKSAAKTAIKGSVEYMVCNDHECLPPSTENFSIELK